MIIDTTIQHFNNSSLNVNCSLNRLVPSWRRSCPHKNCFCNCQSSSTQWFLVFFWAESYRRKCFFLGTTPDTRELDESLLFFRSFTKNDNFSGASFFFVHFFAVVAWLNNAKLKLPIFTLYGGHEHKTTIFVFPFSDSALQINSRKVPQYSRIRTRWNKAIKLDTARIYFFSNVPPSPSRLKLHNVRDGQPWANYGL